MLQNISGDDKCHQQNSLERFWMKTITALPSQFGLNDERSSFLYTMAQGLSDVIGLAMP